VEDSEERTAEPRGRVAAPESTSSWPVMTVGTASASSPGGERARLTSRTSAEEKESGGRSGFDPTDSGYRAGSV
jgi:hypothetical protein